MRVGKILLCFVCIILAPALILGLASCKNISKKSGETQTQTQTKEATDGVISLLDSYGFGWAFTGQVADVNIIAN